MSAPASPLPIDETTIYSLLFFATVPLSSYVISRLLLPSTATNKTRVIYIWHLFDALIHIVFEGSFLYYSLTASHATSLRGSSSAVLYGDLSTAYGANYSPAVLANLWKEYGLADARWGVADVGIVTLEVLTVVIGGPLSFWISEMVRRGEGRCWFWIVVLAVGELYGGWMTFAPEWLTGSQNLNTSNVMYTYFYLFFFNFVWVAIPGWLLYEAYYQLVPAASKSSRSSGCIYGFESKGEEKKQR